VAFQLTVEVNSGTLVVVSVQAVAASAWGLAKVHQIRPIPSKNTPSQKIPWDLTLVDFLYKIGDLEGGKSQFLIDFRPAK